MKIQKCRHRKTWLIAGGFWEWCYQCGAIRLMRWVEGTQNCVTPAEKWTRPTGFPDGTNPALKSRKEES